ncbi:MAG: hypothetical protein MRY64_15510 [Hyphomonadaceae bacterium]|nr:hypothetical protein [Hyphomonadaceae bacterium]
MTDFPDEIDRKRYPWALARFDIAGLVGAIAAFIIGALLGLFWGPLFLIGLAGAAIILLASRHAERTPPPEAIAVVSPVDGVLVSISDAVAPAELRMDARELVCLRIASSPASTNTVHAPIAGEIVSLIEEAGDNAVRTASDPDAAGLAAAYVTIAAGDSQIGLKVSTGGLGPRLEMQREPGDPVRIGRVIGIRRLGGWCDVWLDAGEKLAVWPGMSLKAAETRLIWTGSTTPPVTGRAMRDESAEETEPFEMPELEDEVSDLEAVPREAEDASKQFERLRKRVRETKASEADETDEI